MDLLTPCAFFFLLLTIIVIVLRLKEIKGIKVWCIFLLISVIFAMLAGVLNWFGLAYSLLVAGFAFLYCRQKKIWQALLLIVASLPLFFHFPQFGFHNYAFLDHVRVTPDAIPYSLYFNYDKTLFPIFVMGFSEMSIPVIKWMETIKKVLLYLLVLAPLMLGLSWLFHYVRFCPKWPVYTPVWMLVNLFFTCTAEEVLFRGVIQSQLEKYLQLKYKGCIAVFLAAVLFGAMHYMGGTLYMLLATVAGLFYGHIFYKTKEIRSSVLLHFLLNMLHFFLFTYPALAK